MTLETTKAVRIQPIEFLWLGLYAFAGFSIELLLGILINVVGLDPLSKNIHSFVTGVLWFAFSYLLIQYARKKFDYDVFKIRTAFTLKKLFAVSIIVLIVTFAAFIGFSGFKPLVEFRNGGQGNIITYLLQLFYYFGESALIVSCIAFGQHFFEEQFRLNRQLPTGGLFLAMTWGVIHIFLQGLNGGIYTMLFSVLAGIIYVICEKDFCWSYVFIAIAFIL